jgi:hypothetical protein
MGNFSEIPHATEKKQGAGRTEYSPAEAPSTEKKTKYSIFCCL